MSRARLVRPLRHPDVGWCAAPPVTPAIRRWLADPGSLTAAVRAVSADFAVRVVSQGWQAPLPDEAAVLAALAGQGPGRRAAPGWVREVVLADGDTPLVFAHTAVARRDLAGWPWLRGLAARPLGEILFRHPRVIRLPLRFRRIDRRHPLYHRADQAGAGVAASAAAAGLWARRSLFGLDGRSLLVTEVFLPTLLDRPHP